MVSQRKVPPRRVMQSQTWRQQERQMKRQTWSIKFSFTGTTITKQRQWRRKRCSKKKSAEKPPVRLENRISFRVSATWKSARNRHAIYWASAWLCSPTRPKEGCKVRWKVCVSSFRQQWSATTKSQKKDQKSEKAIDCKCYATQSSKIGLCITWHRTCQNRRLDLRARTDLSWRKMLEYLR